MRQVLGFLLPNPGHSHSSPTPKLLWLRICTEVLRSHSRGPVLSTLVTGFVRGKHRDILNNLRVNEGQY